MIRLGTRASALATTQSAWVARQLVSGGEGEDQGFELVHISTRGDRDQTSPLTQIGGTGVFVSAVREALVAGDVDVVVHSLKDLPTAAPSGIRLAAVPRREDPSDAIVARDGVASLADIAPGGVVGTGSPRRAAQVKLLRPDLVVKPIRGNVDTRMAFVTRGEMDAVVLATAGLNRLGLASSITEAVDPWQFLPAPAQGALAVEVREDCDPQSELGRALSALDHAPTRWAAAAEREVLRALEAGCSAPVAAFGTVSEAGELRLKAGVFGSAEHCVRDVSLAIASEAGAIQAGLDLANELLAGGARNLLNEEFSA